MDAEWMSAALLVIDRTAPSPTEWGFGGRCRRRCTILPESSRAGLARDAPAPVAVWFAAQLALQPTAALAPPLREGGRIRGCGHRRPPSHARRSSCPRAALSQRARAGVLRLLRSQRRAIGWLAPAYDLRAEQRTGQLPASTNGLARPNAALRSGLRPAARGAAHRRQGLRQRRTPSPPSPSKGGARIARATSQLFEPIVARWRRSTVAPNRWASNGSTRART